MDVYLLNVVRPVRIVAPHMIKQKGGAIINISTAWVAEPSAMFPTSAVFRAGLASFTKIFADTYAPQNVRMNNVLPGWIDTELTPELRAEGDARDLQRAIQDLRRDAGFELDERIDLWVDGADVALAPRLADVAADTLSDLVPAPIPADATARATVEIGTGSVRIALRRRAEAR